LGNQTKLSIFLSCRGITWLAGRHQATQARLFSLAVFITRDLRCSWTLVV